MKAISEYIYTIFLVSISGGIMLLLAPSGQGDGIRRAYRYLVSLAVVLALVAPLHDLAGLFSSLDIGESETEETEIPVSVSLLARESVIGKVEKTLEESLFTRYGTPVSVSLEVTGENDNMLIVNAMLCMEAEVQTLSEAANYLSALLDCTVTVNPTQESEKSA